MPYVSKTIDKNSKKKIVLNICIAGLVWEL